MTSLNASPQESQGAQETPSARAAQLATRRSGSAALLEQVLVEGNLEKLTADQRLSYYQQVCESVGLNPLTKPFAYIKLNGKLTLYALKDATDQLRRLHRISVQIMQRQFKEGLYVVTARATTPDGRYDEEDGVVSVRGQGGEALANAMLKAVTKAKRRVTLAVCGLGWLDETEVETIPMAERISVAESGEIAGTSQPPIPHEIRNDTARLRQADEEPADEPPPLDTRPADEIWAESEQRQDNTRTQSAAPATPKQLQTIQRMARAAGKTIPVENLSRAQASEIISSLIGEMDQRAGNGAHAN